MTFDVANPHKTCALALALDTDVRWRGAPVNIKLDPLSVEDVLRYGPNEVRRITSRLV